ncbi:protein OSB4, chloroplastic-like isoform X2 [Miscanthus floridulus]|uniref:protein OSB4, chloroplastic-like isoform X2 n=1 Tax=Miscanthus floridulus TaxID=154761 RepID=UPI00345A93EC
MMHHHLSRLLTRRLPLPVAASSPYAGALSTPPRRAYARRAKPPPAADTGDHAAAASHAAAADSEAKATWQTEKLPGELPRPPTIPFQPRVANAVHLVGTVCAPVHVQQLPDGRFFAVSVLVHDHGINLPKFWVPIVFKDDLAQVAASHLKENDLVSVSGKLTCDSPPFKLADGEANIQLLANSLQFVDSKAVETDAILDEDEGFLEIVEAEKKVEAKKPTSKFSPGTSGYRNKADKFNKLWNDVISRPQDWIDNRPLKKTGSRSAKFPDFKNKVSDEALWLNTAPTSVLEKLDDLVFSSGYATERKNKPFGTGTNWMKPRKSPDASATSKQKLEEDLWRDLVDNPANWWDNRADKPTPKHPDFRNSNSGQGLWIGTKSPRWAIDALPSLKFKGGSKGTRKETLLS